MYRRTVAVVVVVAATWMTEVAVERMLMLEDWQRVVEGLMLADVVEIQILVG